MQIQEINVFKLLPCVLEAGVQVFFNKLYPIPIFPPGCYVGLLIFLFKVSFAEQRKLKN